MVDPKDELVNNVVMMMGLDVEDTKRLKNIMYMNFYKYTVLRIEETAIVERNESINQEIVRMFFIAKSIQGCTKRTLKAYKDYVKAFLQFIDKDIPQITTNDIRMYLAVKKERDKVSDGGADNIRRVLSSFFAWCYDEEYITKNPMKKIKKIRKEKLVKKAFSEMEMERLRAGAIGNIRMTALIEFLLSTGCRISEVYEANINDLEVDELIVHGKGKKDRVVYMNAKARVSLEAYLRSREDENPALFVTELKPHNRLKTSGMEIAIRKLGRKAGVTDTHPHRFRRTAATMALNRGMPIDQVQQMLGHESIETTTLYAVSAQEAVKASHKKYLN